MRPGRRDSKTPMKSDRTESIPAFASVPEALVSWLAVFRPCFTMPVWNHVLVLVSGAILADSDEGGHQFQFDRGHHSNLMAARLASSRGPVLFMS